ncbi:protein TIME FOR COFFEE-like [Arachis stenosperma]|uniref:protein TIME FOR COFFEE-like n=1 Tax=Arachis stenosperma TaxID=217475 RepID=UPI0025AD0581|nr:protein TIME FOR COFFEE-like [Arachis stenosperma]
MLMERTRESKRSAMASSTAAGNGFHRRSRHRTIALRESSEEGVNKRGRSKRLRSSQSRREEGDEHSTEESVGNEQDDDIVQQDAGATATGSVNTTSSFAASDQILRRSFVPPPTLKVTDEMIGVAVPRKARSASVKRSNENCVSASGGGGDRNFRQQSNSPVEPASPSSSSVSGKKKMKVIGDSSETLKSQSSDIEIEIAELLYGLRTSKKNDTSSSKDADKKKVDECNSSHALVPCNSTTAELVSVQTEQSASVHCHGGNAVVNESGSSEAPNDVIGEDKNSGAGCGVFTDGRSASPVREKPKWLTELDVEKQNSASTKVVPTVPGTSGQRVGKFEIDLMAPPPVMPSPEGDDLSKGDVIPETKPWALNLEKKREDSSAKVEDMEKTFKREKTADETEEAKKVTLRERCDVLKHDLEKPNNVNDTSPSIKLEEQNSNKEQYTRLSNPKVEKTAQYSSMPLSTAGSGHPNNLSSVGCTMPSERVFKMDKATGSLTKFEHVKEVPSQPQPKRCATHHYIARNIFLHQQFTKMNALLAPSIGSASLCGTKPNNPSAESLVIGKQSQKHHAVQGKGSSTTSDSSLTAVKSSNNANPTDSTQRMQLGLQQGSHPGSTSNLVHAPAYLLPPGQHQASVAAATSQAGLNSTTGALSYKSHSSGARSLATSSTLPAVAASMSFSYPNFSTSDTPYVTIVQNNGYSFPYSTSLAGANAAIRGANPAQAPQILNGTCYSSQSIHPPQHPQQHPHSQVLVPPSYPNPSTSSSSSSYKQSQGAQFNGNSILTSPPMQSQQSQKQHASLSHHLKHETEVNRDNASSVVNRKSYPQKNVHGHNFTIPAQPVNLSFRPSVISDNVGGNSRNISDKQQQQQASKGGVETTPSQAFAISFGAYNGTNVPSNLNFSAVGQNPVIFHSLPDISWQGYQAASTPHSTQQRPYSITEGKSGGSSSHQEDEKKITHGKSSTNYGPTTLVFDNSSKNVNFMFSPSNGNWPNCTVASSSVTSVSSTAITSAPLSSNASSSQEPSLLHLQKQYGIQQSQQQPAMATWYKAPSTNINSATKFANDIPVFTQTQSKSSTQASNSRSSGRTMDSHLHHAPVITSNAPNLKSYSQERGRISQGRMQISFGGDYTTPLPPQGQLISNNRPVSTTVAGIAGTTPNGGNLKPNPEGRKVSSSMNTSSVNTSQSQQTDNSSAGSGKKSSPVCGRNVPSILSSCPSQLSELKY